MEKIKEIDYLRGLTTIFVILIHLTAPTTYCPKDSLTYQVFGAINYSLNFAVPAFLFISALIMTYQAKHKEKINWFKFISKRILKVLSALILWSIIYTYQSGYDNLTIKRLIDYLTLGSASYHLYFIPLVIQLYLIFPLIWFIAKKVSKIKITYKLSFILCLIIASIVQYYFTAIICLTLFKSFPYFAIVIFSYTLPIALGIWIGFNYNEVKGFFNKYFIIVLISLTSIAIYINFKLMSNYTYDKPTLLFMPVYWTLIILTLTYLLRYIKKSTALTNISKHSFIIYLSHPFILDIINHKTNWQIISLTSSTFINYCLDISIRFIITFTLSYSLAFIWYSIKKLALIKAKAHMN